jgi:peptide/nickel transport system substrate-binding protein
MTRASRAFAALAAVAILLIAWFLFVRPATGPEPGLVSGGPSRGGEIKSTYRLEPKSFNRYLSAFASTELVARLTHDTLVRINRVSGDIEPRLAESWTASDDGLSYTLNLRRDVRFSDGAPFTSADVLFSFTAASSKGSQLVDALRVGGQPLGVSAADDHTVVIRFPSPFAPGLRILDALPIFPRHKLVAALNEGRFDTMWTTATPPADLASLGPFVVAEFVAGQRVVFARNPNFWRKDAAGVQLPYLDRIVVEIVSDQNAEVLRFQAGEFDLTTDEARAEDIAAFRREAQAGRMQLKEVGVSLDANLLWFNLNPGAKAKDSRRAWLQSEQLRKAISHAVDRQAFINTVYLGAGVPVYGPVTPGNHLWYVPDVPAYPHDLSLARALLAEVGLADRNGDGTLEDGAGAPARFSIITQQGHTIRERSVAVIQEQLRQVGFAVDLVKLDPGGLFGRFGAGDYDAMFFGVESSDFDPNGSKEFWLSSGGFHFWNPRQQKPATEWEARIDALFARQETALNPDERRRLFADAQRIFGEHVPALYFAAPTIYVATSARLANVTPALANPKVFWNAEMLAIGQPAAR